MGRHTAKKTGSEKRPSASRRPEKSAASGDRRPADPGNLDNTFDLSNKLLSGKTFWAAIGLAAALVVALVGLAVFFWLGASTDGTPDQGLSREDQITKSQLTESYDRGEYKAIIPRLEEFLAENNDSKVREMLATSYLLTGSNKQALDEYQTLLKERPKDAELLYKIGILLEHTNRQNEAITYLGRAVQAAPNVALFHAELARLNTRAKFYANALDQWKMVLNLLPANDRSRADVLAEMANIYILQNDFTQAKGVIVTGLNLDPQNKALLALKDRVEGRNFATPAPSGESTSAN